MHYYAQISGGKVVAVTQTSGPIDSPDMIALPVYDEGKLGYFYAGGVFTAPPPQPFVQTITSRQGKRALVAADLYQPALTALNALPEPDKTLAMIDWDAPTWQRSDQTLAAMAGALGLTDAQLDALFTQAASL
jgi:hypothetical protein